MPNIKAVLVAETVLLYVLGHLAFKIDLGLSLLIVKELLKRAVMLRPNNLALALELAQYKKS